MSDAEILNYATEFAFPVDGGIIGCFLGDGTWHCTKIVGDSVHYLSKTCGWTLADTDKPLTKDFSFRYLREMLRRAGIDESSQSVGVFDISKRRRIGNLFNAVSTDLGMTSNA